MNFHCVGERVHSLRKSTPTTPWFSAGHPSWTSPEAIDTYAHVISDQTLLADGGHVEDPAPYVRRVTALLLG